MFLGVPKYSRWGQKEKWLPNTHFTSHMCAKWHYNSCILGGPQGSTWVETSSGYLTALFRAQMWAK